MARLVSLRRFRKVEFLYYSRRLNKFILRNTYLKKMLKRLSFRALWQKKRRIILKRYLRFERRVFKKYGKNPNIYSILFKFYCIIRRRLFRKKYFLKKRLEEKRLFIRKRFLKRKKLFLKRYLKRKKLFLKLRLKRKTLKRKTFSFRDIFFKKRIIKRSVKRRRLLFKNKLMKKRSVVRSLKSRPFNSSLMKKHIIKRASKKKVRRFGNISRNQFESLFKKYVKRHAILKLINKRRKLLRQRRAVKARLRLFRSKAYIWLNFHYLLDNGYLFSKTKRAWSMWMVNYILGQRNKFFILRFDKVVFLFRKMIKFLRKIVSKRNTVYLAYMDKVNPLPKSMYNLLLYNMRRFNVKFYYYIEKWFHGMLTNYFYALFWVKRRKVGKFRKVSKYVVKRLPDCLVLFGYTDKIVINNIVSEMYSFKKPIIGFIDIEKVPFGFDYFIPCNNVSFVYVKSSFEVVLNVMFVSVLEQSRYVKWNLLNTYRVINKFKNVYYKKKEHLARRRKIFSKRSFNYILNLKLQNLRKYRLKKRFNFIGNNFKFLRVRGGLLDMFLNLDVNLDLKNFSLVDKGCFYMIEYRMLLAGFRILDMIKNKVARKKLGKINKTICKYIALLKIFNKKVWVRSVFLSRGRFNLKKYYRFRKKFYKGYGVDRVRQGKYMQQKYIALYYFRNNMLSYSRRKRKKLCEY